jgi:hypothetical protein
VPRVFFDAGQEDKDYVGIHILKLKAYKNTFAIGRGHPTMKRLTGSNS